MIVQFIRLKNGEDYYGYIEEDRGTMLVLQILCLDMKSRRNVYHPLIVPVGNILSISGYFDPSELSL